MSNTVNEPHKIVVLNDYGEKLVGLLHDTGSKDVVITCHGFTGYKEHFIMVNICGALEKEGISAFRFDFSGNGESDGTLSYGNYMKEAEDIRAVVKYFNGRNRNVSAIVGHSKGGDVVLLYASKYHDIPMIVNISGCYDLQIGIADELGEDFMERIKQNGYIESKNEDVPYRVTEEGLMDRLNTNMHEAALKIDTNCRVLTVHGLPDKVITVENAYEFSKIIKNHKLQTIEGANHCYTEHQAELALVVVDFIKSCMEQDEISSTEVLQQTI